VENKSIMKKALLTILIGFLFAEVFSQQTYQYRYHIFDDYLLNPAYVGTNDYYSIQIGHDQRFRGLSNSTPTTYIASVHSRVGRGYLFAKDGKINKFFGQFGSVALGFQLTQYSYGPERETNIGVTYGYHLDLSPNLMTKSPRKMVFAFTPRLQRLGFDIGSLGLSNINTGGDLIIGENVDPIMEDIKRLSSWVFTTDVGALYQTAHVDVGVAGLSIVPYKNNLETDSIYIDDASMFTYDSLYSSKFMANFKVKFLTMHESPTFDLDFVPSLAVMYAPKTGHSEYYVDLMLNGFFKKHIAGIRSEILFNGQLGLSVHYVRSYFKDRYTKLLNPYVAFDFKNFGITYMQSIYLDNELTSTSGISSGGQISLVLKLGNDRIVRKTAPQSTWK
jgi:hypothetical protein